MQVAGASAVVTGAASGLGEAVARALAAQGAHVVVADLAEANGRRVAADIGGDFARTDVTREDDVAAAIEVALSRAPLRVLVSCAGIGPPLRVVGRDGTPHSLQLFASVINVNLIGTFNCLRLAAAAMSRQEPAAGGVRGVVVNTASIAAFDGQVGQAAYAASKGGIVGLTLPAARDLAVVGVRVVTVAPGLFDTPIYGSGEAVEAMKGKLVADVVFPRRFGEPAEFADFVSAAIGNDYLNGETVRLDGGARLSPTA